MQSVIEFLNWLEASRLTEFIREIGVGVPRRRIGPRHCARARDWNNLDRGPTLARLCIDDCPTPCRSCGNASQSMPRGHWR